MGLLLVRSGEQLIPSTGAVVVDRCPEGLAQIFSDVVLEAERVQVYGFADGQPWGEQDAWFLTVVDALRAIPPAKERIRG